LSVISEAESPTGHDARPARRRWVDPGRNLIIEGDSLSDSAWLLSTWGQTSWPVQFSAANPSWTLTNLATVGHTVYIDMIGDGATVDAAFVPSARNVLVFWGGTNDMGDDDRTPLQAWTAVRDYCLARRAAHPELQIVVLNCIYGNTNLVATTDEYNALLAADHWFCDVLVDVCTPIGTQAANPGYYVGDNTHLNTTGEAIVKGLVETALAESFASLALEVSSNGRYLQQSDGTPFRIHAEAAWLINYLSLSAAGEYLNECASKGINLIRVFAPYTRLADGPLADVNGNYGFTTPDDFTTPFVDAWWTHLENIIRAANARKIVVSVAVLYYGFDGDDWGICMATKSAAQHQTYGAAVAARLAAHPNVMFEGMGDSTPPEATRTTGLVTGLRSLGPKRIITAQPVRGVNSTVLQPTTGNWDVNFCYSTAITYAKAIDGWNENVGPTWVGEPYYEHRTSPTTSVRNVREQGWWAVTSGSHNYLYGNEKIYNFDHPVYDHVEFQGEPISAAYNDPGRVAYKAFGLFMRSIEWWRLVPDQGSSLVTAGRNTYGNSDYVTVAKASSPQDLALIYIPAGGSITVALSGFSGSVTATWVDPATGARSAATGSPFAASGTHAFVASSEKGNNSAGDPDWVLLLES
jgi:hypothetical protein